MSAEMMKCGQLRFDFGSEAIGWRLSSNFRRIRLTGLSGTATCNGAMSNLNLELLPLSELLLNSPAVGF